MPDFDVIVLGGGSAGSSAAVAASECGARTAMINVVSSRRISMSLNSCCVYKARIAS